MANCWEAKGKGILFIEDFATFFVGLTRHVQQAGRNTSFNGTGTNRLSKSRYRYLLIDIVSYLARNVKESESLILGHRIRGAVDDGIFEIFVRGATFSSLRPGVWKNATLVDWPAVDTKKRLTGYELKRSPSAREKEQKPSKSVSLCVVK